MVTADEVNAAEWRAFEVADGIASIEAVVPATPLLFLGDRSSVEVSYAERGVPVNGGKRHKVKIHLKMNGQQQNKVRAQNTKWFEMKKNVCS